MLKDTVLFLLSQILAFVIQTFMQKGPTAQKSTIRQVATSKNVLFPGHNHLLTTGADGPSL